MLKVSVSDSCVGACVGSLAGRMHRVALTGMQSKSVARVSRRFASCLAAAVLVGALAGCSHGKSPQPAARASASVAASAKAQRYTNAFSYCRAVGTLDQPDAHYIGPNPPPAVIAGLVKRLGADPAAAHSSAFTRGTDWRCMDGAVYACAVGANLPCESQADTRRTPTRAESAWCAAHPDSGFIPMYVTGHATVYDWHCTGATAAAGKPIAEVDARGFIVGIWYKIPAPATHP